MRAFFAIVAIVEKWLAERETGYSNFAVLPANAESQEQCSRYLCFFEISFLRIGANLRLSIRCQQIVLSNLLNN